MLYRNIGTQVERYICIHGHFYQPPRENPWLEAIEIQDSAYPYHDWNEKICAECYAPNSASRLLDGEGRIMRIVSNYAKMSFNFGPTLLSWIQDNAADVYRSLQEADRRSIEQRSGHGNAIAQAYNHIIMPLAALRDKRTQIIWGIKDFEYRFKRYPEGMWLPETAVDLESLDILAEFGIKFTVLAPHQALRVRRASGGKWEDVSGGHIDPARAYLCRLPSDREISIFFYDGQISRAVAFEEGLLNKGENFLARLSTGFSDSRKWPQILSIASDGETYGHHHKFGDMALAFTLGRIEADGLGTLTNYGEYLDKFPPAYEVEIAENTSWSCAHGIERWKDNCGCNSGGNTGWNQEWRKPLRTSLDWLRDRLAPEYEGMAELYLKEPWLARDEYIGVILERSEDRIEEFLKKHAIRDLTLEEKTVVLKLMEMQRYAMLMYTSCGWFFDELSGIETVQIIHYAGRVIQLSEGLFGGEIERPFLDRLSKAKSNLAEYGDGGRIYDMSVRPTVIDLRKVAVHYALSSTIAEYGDESKIYCYRVKKEDYQRTQVEKTKLVVGRVGITSEITLESEGVSFCALHMGGHVFNGGVQASIRDGAYQSAKGEITSAFEKGDFAGVVKLMDSGFGMHNYSLLNLFRDEQRKIINFVIGEKIEEFGQAYRPIYESDNVLAGFLREAGIPVPKIFLTTAEFILNFDMEKAFSGEEIDAQKILSLIKDINKWNVSLDAVKLELIVRRALEGIMDKLNKMPADMSLLPEVSKMIGLIRSMPFVVNLWRAQNVWYALSKTIYRELLEGVKSGDERAPDLLNEFRQIGHSLFFNMTTILQE